MIIANDPQQKTITLERLLELKTQFIAAKTIDNLLITGLSPERQASICGGLAILIAIFKLFSIDEMDYSDFSLREGLLHEMQQKLALKDIRTNTIANLSERNAIDKVHAGRVANTADWLFIQVQKEWQLDSLDNHQLLVWAAQLHEIGLSINSSGLHKHSAYVVENSQLPGFTQQQQTLLSCLIRFYRKKIRLEAFPQLLSLPHFQILQLIVLLRLAVLLNQKRLSDQHQDLAVTVKGNSMLLQFPVGWLSEQTLLLADLQQEQKYLKKVGFLIDFV